MNAAVMAGNPAPARLNRAREMRPVRYVGDMGFCLGDIWGRGVENSCDAWFEGAAVFYVHTARTAIRQACALLKLRDGDEVLVPAYNCGSEVDALLEGGATIRFFRITSAGEIDFEDLRRRIGPATRVVYVIHYFGFPQGLAAVADLCERKGLHLVEDCALGTFTEVGGHRIGRVGDLAVYNFPKCLPVPDGGALVINNPDLCGEGWALKAPELRALLGNASRLARQGLLRALPDALARNLDGWIRSHSGEDDPSGPGRREMPHSYYWNASLSRRSISKGSAFLVNRVDFSEVRARRRRNFCHLLELLAGESRVTPLYRALPDGVCPLCLPIMVGPARPFALQLASWSIPALPWWSGYNRKCLDWDAFPDACHLKDHVVALPVHHQLSDAAVECVARRVVDCLERLQPQPS